MTINKATLGNMGELQLAQLVPYQGMKQVFMPPVIGVFLITLKNSRNGSIRALFSYYDTKLNKVTASELHLGLNYYKAFTMFMLKVISNKLQVAGVLPDKVILAPNYYINKTVVEYINTISGLKVDNYSTRSFNHPIKAIIRRRLKEIVDLETLINRINTDLNQFILIPIKEYKQAPKSWNAGSNNIRGYATYINKKQSKPTITLPDSSGLVAGVIKEAPTQKSKHWETLSVSSPGGIGSAQINGLVNSLFRDIIPKGTPNGAIAGIAVQLVGDMGNGSFRSLSYVDIIDPRDKESERALINSLGFRMEIIQQKYLSESFSRMLLRYKILSKAPTIKFKDRAEINEEFEEYKTTHNGSILPETMDLTQWGDVIKRTKRLTVIKMANGLIAEVIRHGYTHENIISVFMRRAEGEVRVLSAVDKSMGLPSDLSHFVRTIEKKTTVYRKGVVVNLTEYMDRNFIPILKPRRIPRKFKILTMDLETRNQDGVLLPVCVSTSDGKDT